MKNSIVYFHCKSCGAIFDEPLYLRTMVYDPNYITQFALIENEVCPFCDSTEIDAEEEEI